MSYEKFPVWGRRWFGAIIICVVVIASYAAGKYVGRSETTKHFSTALESARFGNGERLTSEWSVVLTYDPERGRVFRLSRN
jgi:hypothetical protein